MSFLEGGAIGITFSAGAGGSKFEAETFVRLAYRSSDAPERQFVDICALRALFDLGWDCTLWVALTAERERRTRVGVNNGDHLPTKTAKKLVIGLIPVCRQLTQFFELGLWHFDNDAEPNIRVTRPGKVASGVNVSGGHIQGAKLFDVGAYDS